MKLIVKDKKNEVAIEITEDAFDIIENEQVACMIKRMYKKLKGMRKHTKVKK